MGAGFYRRAAARLDVRGWLRHGALLVALAGVVELAACRTVPITGRQSFNLLSADDDKKLGAQEYSRVLAEADVADDDPRFAMVKQVCDRLVAVADDPYDFDWEVHLIRDDQTVNAWCMPGGKMAVYTGILPVTESDVGLAVVMGHEIGHAVAGHGTERMTSQLGMEVVLGFINGDYQELAAQAGVLLISLPFSRKHELEADRIGLIYMARAGYDPQEAVHFWKRMAEQSGGAPPELLSTHPSDQTRIDRIEKLLPEAMAEYQRARGAP